MLIKTETARSVKDRTTCPYSTEICNIGKQIKLFDETQFSFRSSKTNNKQKM